MSFTHRYSGSRSSWVSSAASRCSSFNTTTDRSDGDHHEECAGARVSPRSGNTDNLKMRILKSDHQRECVIDVVIDVGVDDDGLRTLGRRAGVRQIGLPEGQRRRAQ